MRVSRWCMHSVTDIGFREALKDTFRCQHIGASGANTSKAIRRHWRTGELLGPFLSSGRRLVLRGDEINLTSTSCNVTAHITAWENPPLISSIACPTLQYYFPG